MAGADRTPASALRLEEVTRALDEILFLFGGSDREFPSHDLKGFGWAARRTPVACGLAQQCCNSDFQWHGLDRSNQAHRSPNSRPRHFQPGHGPALVRWMADH